MTYDATPGLWPIHGDGVLARQGDLVLLIHPAGGAFTDRLLDLLGDAARTGEGGRRFADLVSGAFDADAETAVAGDEAGPAAVAFGPDGGGTAVAVYGTAWAEITTADGTAMLETAQPYGRLRCILPSTPARVRAGVRPGRGDVITDRYLRLVGGIVRAVALVYVPEGPAAAAVAQHREIPAGATAASPEPGGGPAAAGVPEGGPAGPPVPGGPPAVPPVPETAPSAAAGVAGGGPAGPPVPGGPPAVPPVPETAPSAAAGVAGGGPAGPPVPGGPPAVPPVPETAPSAAAGVAEGGPAGPPVLGGGPAAAGVPEAGPAMPPVPGAAPAAEPAVPGHAPDGLAVPPVPDPPQAAPPLPESGPAAPPVPDGPDTGDAAAPAEALQQDFISVSFSGDQAAAVPQREPLPLGAEPPDEKNLSIGDRLPPAVLGVYCKNGHFNDPEARYCAVCGIGMAQLTKVPKTGTRPPLGVLVLDDGSVFQLDADYVIGREPSLDASVADGNARPLRIAGASGLVSRIHARVDLDGWQVLITDLSSANGTQIRLPGEDHSRRLTPGVRVPLAAGTQIRLGNDCGFRYDSHRHR